MSNQQNDELIGAEENTATGSKKDGDADVKREAIRQAHWRMFVKFCAVFAALLAYTLLKGMEEAKSSYDEEHNRPVVIVNDDDATKVADYLERKRKGENPQAGQQAREKVRYDARLLRVSDVEKLFDNHQAQGGGAGFDDETLRAVKETINKIKYQSFKDEKELVASLDEEILAGAEYEKKSLLATEEAESKAQASKLPGLTQDKLAVRDRLEELYRSENGISRETKSTEASFSKNFNAWIADKTKILKDNKTPVPTEKEINAWRSTIAGVSPGSQSEDQSVGDRRRGRGGQNQTNNSLDENNLLRWLVAIDNSIKDNSRLADLKIRIDEIDREAQEQIRAVYTQLKPKLPGLLKGAVNAPLEGDSWLSFFNPRSVLDEKSGVHVIYRTLWLTCVMVLIFGLIFILLLMLRPVPFVATGTDTLMEHTGELFKRSEGAAPQLAKSLAVTAAALGVGAAVAVASSNGVAKKPRGAGDDGYVVNPAPGEDARPGAPGREGRNGRPGEGGVVEHVFTLSPPIVVPSPFNVHVETPSVTFDTTRLGVIESDIGRLKEVTGTTLPLADSRLGARLDGVEGVAQGLKDNIGDVRVQALASTVASHGGKLGPLEAGVNDYYNWKTNVETKFSDALEKFQAQLAATNSAVADLRDNSFERLQNSGGRNLLTRTVQVFKGDKYLVTNQSLKALKALMIKSPPVACPPPQSSASGAAAQARCCNGSPTTAEYSCNLDIDAIIGKLSSMVGDAPQSESDFMRKLRAATRFDGTTVGKTTVDQWKAIILKYTRVAY